MPISERQVYPTQVTPRFDTIDLLRGLSILAVLLHLSIRFSFQNLSLKPLLAPWLFHLLLENGGNGVTVFFAISGFLIATTSMRRFGSLAAMRPGIFYRIRFARIAPLLLLLIAVLSALHLAHVDGYVVTHGTLRGAILSALTFTLNHYEAVHGYLLANWDVLWSLSHEFLVVFGVQLHSKLAPTHPTGPLWLWFLGILLLTAPLGWLVARFFSEPLNRALRPTGPCLKQPHRSLS